MTRAGSPLRLALRIAANASRILFNMGLLVVLDPIIQAFRSMAKHVSFDGDNFMTSLFSLLSSYLCFVVLAVDRTKLFANRTTLDNNNVDFCGKKTGRGELR